MHALAGWAGSGKARWLAYKFVVAEKEKNIKKTTTAGDAMCIEDWEKKNADDTGGREGIGHWG